MANNTTRIERETTIVFNDEEKTATVWTCSPVMMRRLDKLAENYPDAYRCVRVDGDKATSPSAKKYEIGKRYIRFGKPASEAQKERGRKVAAAVAARKLLKPED